MRKFRSKIHVGYEYQEIWSDARGSVLEVTKNPTGMANPPERFWSSKRDFDRYYEEIIPEKWIVVREWSSGSIQSDIRLPFKSRLEAEVYVANEERRLSKITYSDFAQGRYTHKIVKVE